MTTTSPPPVEPPLAPPFGGEDPAVLAQEFMDAQWAADADLFRQILRELTIQGADLARIIHQQVITQAQTLSDPVEARHARLVDLSVRYERVSRNIRRNILLVRHLAEAPRPRPAPQPGATPPPASAPRGPAAVPTERLDRLDRLEPIGQPTGPNLVETIRQNLIEWAQPDTPEARRARQILETIDARLASRPAPPDPPAGAPRRNGADPPAHPPPPARAEPDKRR